MGTILQFKKAQAETTVVKTQSQKSLGQVHKLSFVLKELTNQLDQATPKEALAVKTQVGLINLQIFLNQLLGWKKVQESVDLRRATLKDITDEDLCTILVESYDLQWKAQPAFFQALSDEIQSRAICTTLLNTTS